jgi:hypothetical protein
MCGSLRTPAVRCVKLRGSQRIRSFGSSMTPIGISLPTANGGFCFLKSVYFYRRCRPEHYTTDYIVTAPKATAFTATHFPAPSFRWTCNRSRGCHCSLPLTTIDTLVIFQQTCPAVVFDRFQKESTLRLMRYCHRQSKIVCKVEESHN